MSERWEPCPRCGSNKVQKLGIAFFLLMGLGLLSFGAILFFIPFLSIVLLVTGGALVVMSPFSRGMLQCKDCKKSWKFPAKTKANSPA